MQHASPDSPSRSGLLLWLACVALGTGTFAVPAAAGTFTSRGDFLFDPQAAARLDFEEDSPETPVDAQALSGGRVLMLMPYGGVDLPVSLPPVPRSYRASVWIRDREVVADLEISYSDRVDEVAALFPTGRMTSDGWVELGNRGVRIDGARVKKVTLGLFAAGEAVADAFEMVAEEDLSNVGGPLNPPCDGIADASACGPEQICVWGECRNVGAWFPPIPEDRDQVADYLGARIESVFGPYLERTLDLPDSRVALQQMRSAKNRWQYWNGFLLAVRRLHDGHTTTNGIADFVLQNPRPIAVCFIEGDADLSQKAMPKDDVYLDVLVSHTGGNHHLNLHPGDRLVRIDGRHPIDWARSLVAVHLAQPATSNHRTFAELASSLNRLISRYAHTLEVIRCNSGTGMCGSIDTIDIQSIPFDPPGTQVSSVTCDNRPLRHLLNSPANHSSPGDGVYSGLVKESTPNEGIYGMEWESLFTNGNDALSAALNAAVSTWKTVNAKGVILDHRIGTGGTILGPEILWNYAVPRHPSDFYLDRPRAEDEQPALADGKALFEMAVFNGSVQYAGSNNPVTNVPVALLLTEDVSASDWLALGFKGAPKVKLFAPFETNGGFSTRYSFGYWLGVNYVIATGDTFLPDGSTHNGKGVSPDVVVLPKQSDLLVGKDTLFETAIAWVRQEIVP